MTRPPLRLLWTSSRDILRRGPVICALSDACLILRPPGRTNPQYARPIQLVHGAGRGGDTIAAEVWADWVGCWPDLYLKAEPHPADWDQYRRAAGPRRNSAMVKAGADLCVTLALENSTGTPDCARKARAAGIRVVDFGVPTLDTATPSRGTSHTLEDAA